MSFVTSNFLILPFSCGILTNDEIKGIRYDVYNFETAGPPRPKWNGIVGDLVTGGAHMSFAALSVSKARSQVMDFSTPFFFSGVSFLGE